MNDYKLIADAYKKAAEDGNLTKEQAAKECKVLDFLNICDEEDICNMFNSAAFNEIAKAYLRIAVRELTEEETITEEQARAIRNRYALLFSEKTAQDVLK